MFAIIGLIFWIGAFVIFSRVLNYFNSVEDFGDILAMKLLSMMVITFFALLLFSNIINSLSHLYLSRDLPLLHSLPVSSGDTFLSRWISGAFDSSWMVILFSMPVFFILRYYLFCWCRILSDCGVRNYYFMHYGGRNKQHPRDAGSGNSTGGENTRFFCRDGCRSGDITCSLFANDQTGAIG